MAEQKTVWFLEPYGRKKKHTNKVISSLLHPEDAMESIETTDGPKDVWRMRNHAQITALEGDPELSFRKYKKVGGGQIRPCNLQELHRKAKQRSSKKKTAKKK